MADPKRYVVTLDSKRALADVKRDLDGAGLTVEQEMHEIGVLTGTSKGGVAKLRKIAGVADVSEEGEVSVGPPGAKMTW